jgi:hypothetical protein
MTQCSFSGGRFRSPSGHEVRASFDGGDITSDAGVMLLRRADDAERLVERFSRCFRDHRDALRVEHSVADLVRQRVYGLALGYEDQSDHDTLRLDPLLAAMVGRRDTGIRCRTPPRRFSGDTVPHTTTAVLRQKVPEQGRFPGQHLRCPGAHGRRASH